MARIASALALMLTSTLACGQLYTWRDAEQGSTRVSAFPPPWYSPNAASSGPTVVVTRGADVIDDTSLPLAERARLSTRHSPRPRETTVSASPARATPEPAATFMGGSETARLVHEAFEAEAARKRAAEQLALARRRAATGAELEAAAAAERQAQARADQARRLATESMQREARQETDESRRSGRR